MTENPAHLKIFPISAPQDAPVISPADSAGDELLAAFAASTGWPLRRGDDALPGDFVWSTELVANQRLALSRPADASEAVSRDTAIRLANALAKQFRDLAAAENAIRHREAELAAGIPVSSRADETRHLADRLEAVLKAGAAAVGCQAAAVYLLDDGTSQLKLRASWGLPVQRLLDAPRPLEAALADLEALIGHAVVLDNVAKNPIWNCPEGFPASVCVPIATPATPLGTVWFFAERPRSFSRAETDIFEVVAGRLSAELEREVLLSEAGRGQLWERAQDQVAQYQDNRLPRIRPLVDDWQVAGWTAPARRVNGDFFDWSVLPTGDLSLAVGSAVNSQGRSTMTAAFGAAGLQIAVKSEAGHRHTPRQLVARVNETLWTHSPGDQFASLAYAVVDAEQGTARLSRAGGVRTFVVGSQAAEAAAPLPPTLGSDPDTVFPEDEVHVAAGESLVLLSEGWFASSHGRPSGVNEAAIREALQQVTGESADEILDGVRQVLQAHCPDWPERDTTVLIAHRRR